MIKIKPLTIRHLAVTLTTLILLSVITAPIYNQYTQKNRRTDATLTLIDLQNNQTKFHSSSMQYAVSLAQLGLSKNNGKFVTPNGYYELILTSLDPKKEFAITAIPITSNDQVNDNCTSFAVTQQGPDTSTQGKQICWNL